MGEEGGYRVIELHLLIPVDHLPCSVFIRYVLFNGCHVAYAEITKAGEKVSRQNKQQREGVLHPGHSALGGIGIVRLVVGYLGNHAQVVILNGVVLGLVLYVR